MTLCRYCTMPIVAKVTMIDMTTISSISVKPRCDRRLPITVFRPIKRGCRRGRVDVEHVLAAPARGIGIVLVGPLAPPGALGHRINRNTAKKFQLASGCIVVGGHAVDKRVEIGRIALAAGFDVYGPDLRSVGCVLEFVDRRSDV